MPVGERCRRAVCGRTARTVRCGGGRQPQPVGPARAVRPRKPPADPTMTDNNPYVELPAKLPLFRLDDLRVALGSTVQGQIVAAVERKSVADLVSSLTSGRLRYALGELSALLRAAVVVEDHYGQIFAVEHVRGGVVADGLAELQIRWAMMPIVFCQTRKLAEEWTY